MPKFFTFTNKFDKPVTVNVSLIKEIAVTEGGTICLVMAGDSSEEHWVLKPEDYHRLRKLVNA